MEPVFRVPAKKFSRDSALLAALNQEEVSPVMRRNAKGAIRIIVLSSAPGSRRVQGGKAATRGRARVRGDIYRAVQPVHTARAETTDVRSAVEALRDGKGRVRKKPRKPTRVPSTALRDYVREKQGDVGAYGGGWNAGAAKLGYRPPQYIWKQSSKGSATIRESSRGIRIRVTNSVSYAGNINYSKRRIRWALDQQHKKIRRQLPNATARAARRAGFRARG